MLFQEVIVSMCEHDLGEVPHDWLRLNVQVAWNIIAVPAANQFDDVAVNT